MEKKSKNELIEEAQGLADKYNEKKGVIKTALDDLDAKSIVAVGKEHLTGMAVIEELFTELDQIELEQMKVIDQIKNAK